MSLDNKVLFLYAAHDADGLITATGRPVSAYLFERSASGHQICELLGVVDKGGEVGRRLFLGRGGGELVSRAKSYSSQNTSKRR